MSILRSSFGELRWTPPDWIQRLGPKRFVAGIAAIALIAVAAIAGYRYYKGLPKPPRVVAEVIAPGVTPVVDDVLQPPELAIDFTMQTDPRMPPATVQSMARLDLVGQEVEDGVSIEPVIAGRWRWDNERRLVFQPEEDWPAGQKYTVNYEASLFAPNLTFERSSVDFTTPPLSAKIEALDFYQDPVEASVRKVVATIAFSHPVDPESLRKNLSYAMRDVGASINDPAKPVDYTLSFDKNKRKAFVHSTPIEIPAQENYLTMTVDEGVAPLSGPSRTEDTLAQNVRIPDIASYFRVSKVESLITRNEDNEPLQTLIIAFTDRVGIDALNNRLSAYILPTRLTIDGNQVTNKYWRAAREVTPEVLAQARKIDVTLNPVENDSAQLHSATLDVPVYSYVYLRIEDGLQSDGRFVLNVPSEHLVRASSYPLEAKIAQDGALLPLTGSQRLTFESRGVSTLRVDIGRLIDSQVNHLASQTSGDIRSPRFNNYAFDEDNLTTRVTRYIDLNVDHPRKAVYSNLDLSELAPDGGYYFVTVQGWDKQRGYAVGGRDRRFILITDLGLLVKSNSDNTQEVFVHGIESGLPVGGATVSLLGKNGLPIAERETAFDGHVVLPDTSKFEREKAPTVFVVRMGADSVFMPYARGDRMLRYSRFDIGGEYVHQRRSAEQLRAQVFSDRGLYRPGDTAQLAAIVKRNDWGSVGTLPLVLDVQDPRGQIVLSRSLRLPADGFFEASFATEAASPTGNYSATLYLVEQRNRRRVIGSTSFKVEEFQPDTLRIRAMIAGQKPRGWLKPDGLSIDVSLQNLFGTAAADRRVSGNVELQPSAIRFSQHEDFVFDDPLRDANATAQKISLPLTPATTDANGSASLPLDLRQYDKGIYRLTAAMEGFEAGGGRSVKAQASTMMSPLDYLVGYKTDGDLSYVDRNAQRSVRFLAVDSDAMAIALSDLTLSISQERYVSTLIKRPDGTYAYQSILKESPVSTQPFSIDDDGDQFVIPTDNPGSFVVRVTDADGLAYSKVRYTVAGSRNVLGNLERDAELAVTLKQDSVDPGQLIEMEITAPYTGTGLITIERDRVYAYRWFKTDANTTVQSIRVPARLEGNAYVNVAFVRELDSPEIFVSPLSYAVRPFAISRAARTVNIDLDVPALVRPGEPLKVAYRSSKPSRVVIYAVDEGILQVANYEMPDPLSIFLRKMALQVDTYQMVDLILPEFEAHRRAAAPGGGEGASLAGKNLNPFRRKSEPPVAFWSGIVDAGPDSRSVTFTVPDYFNGQLRVMAVAVSEDSVGQTSTSTIARGPFVITPNLLTAAAPGDLFDVTVGLSNNLDDSGENAEISLTASPSSHLEIVGDAERVLRVNEGSEAQAVFSARALDSLGPASIVFEAHSGETRVRRKATLSIRPSVAYVATMDAGTGDKDPLKLTFKRSLYDQLSRHSAAASASPLVLADGLLNYLEVFPHYCAEQIVSRVFPQIGFLGQQDYTIDESRIRQSFDSTIVKLRGRQHPEGGFLFWATSAEPADFASVYIMHFLTDATELGLSVPRDMLASGLDYLRQLAGREVVTLQDARLRAYAIYVLTRNATITTNYLTNLHEYLDREQADAWRSDLTAAYMASSYMLLKKSQLGARLVDSYALNAGEEFTSDFDTRLGRDAQYVYLLSRHFPDQLDRLSAESIQRLVEPVMQNRFNTLSSAYTVLALGAYTKALSDAGDRPRLTIRETGDANKVLAAASVFARAAIGNDVADIEIAGAEGRSVYYVLSQKGFDRVAPAEALAEGLEISREYLNDNNDTVDSAMIGDELTVRLRVRSTGATRSNVALVDLLPGGFEVLVDSVRDQYEGWSVDYKDIREDRVVVYGTFGNRMTEIRYRVKLTSAGDFVVPAAYAGSMYDRSIQANTKPGRFVVRAMP